MLWNTAYLQGLGTRPDITTAMPVLSSPVFGVDLAARNTVFSDTGGTTAAANGATVARINDIFGGAAYFTQTTAGARPIVQANAAGQLAGLRFAADGNGAMKWLSMAGATNPGTLFQGKTFTLLLAYRRSAVDAFAGVFAAGNSTGGDGGHGYDMLLVEGAQGGGFPMVFRNTGSETKAHQLSGPTYAANQIAKLIVRAAPANGIELRLKSASGSYTGTDTLLASADLTTWNSALLGSELGYGSRTIPTDTFYGDIFEMRWWNTRATDAQMTQLAAYLDAKWGA